MADRGNALASADELRAGADSRGATVDARLAKPAWPASIFSSSRPSLPPFGACSPELTGVPPFHTASSFPLSFWSSIADFAPPMSMRWSAILGFGIGLPPIIGGFESDGHPPTKPSRFNVPSMLPLPAGVAPPADAALDRKLESVVHSKKHEKPASARLLGAIGTLVLCL